MLRSLILMIAAETACGIGIAACAVAATLILVGVVPS